MSYIEIKSFSYNYPEEKKKALEDISLNIEKGQIIFITGKSGSGKSTLAKAISGAIPNFYGGTVSGEIKINGVLIENIAHKERAKEITMVFQDPERQLMMNKVHREVAFGLENIGIEENQIKRRVWEGLQFSNIIDLAYRDIDTLSGGQKQKIALTSAVSYLPKCIILDEPTSQLDPSSAEEVVRLVKKINEELGITVIVIEQRIDRWFDAADKVVLMKNGKEIFHGSRDELYFSKDEELLEFLPSYLVLAKKLNVKTIPESFKHCRELLKDCSFQIEDIKQMKHCEEIINISNLKFSYENNEAIRNINVKIMKGEFIGILGSNGAGKSTFLKSLMKLIDYKGSIKLFEKELKKLKLKDIVKDIGYVSQNPNDYISKDTVYEELKFTLDNYGIEDKKLIEETLKALNIYDLKDKNPRDISGGERQRVAVASVLVLKPKILLLDEPTRGLDREAKKDLGKILAELNEKGTTVILVTHDVEFASDFCNRFLLMFNGEIVSDGNLEEVFKDGIYFTTSINKLLRDNNENIFTLEQALKGGDKR